MSDLPRKFSLPLFLGAILVMISCLANISVSRTSNEDNVIRLVTGGLLDFQYSSFSILDSIFEDLSYSLLFSPPIEAIYQLGDSISDTGNYIIDEPDSSFAQYPYGQTYFHKPTGRCSDGLLMIDYFAEFLKLPFLDPYLKTNGNFTHGVNFAVSGATALDCSTLSTKYNVSASTTNHSLPVQLGWFKSHLDSICANNTSECKTKLSKALVLVGEIGGNDYNFAFFQGKSIKVAYQMVPDVIEAIKTAVEEVIHLGATRVVVPGNFPVGCMTIYLALYKTSDSTMYDELKCLKNLNSFAKFHNDRLQHAIGELQEDHPNVGIIYLDYYATLREILAHATSYGFDRNDIHKACCGMNNTEYNFDNGRWCGGDGVPFCKNPQERLSWDGVHLSQHAYHIMAKRLMRDILYGVSNKVS